VERTAQNLTASLASVQGALRSAWGQMKQLGKTARRTEQAARKFRQTVSKITYAKEEAELDDLRVSTRMMLPDARCFDLRMATLHNCYEWLPIRLRSVIGIGDTPVAEGKVLRYRDFSLLDLIPALEGLERSLSLFGARIRQASRSLKRRIGVHEEVLKQERRPQARTPNYYGETTLDLFLGGFHNISGGFMSMISDPALLGFDQRLCEGALHDFRLIQSLAQLRGSLTNHSSAVLTIATPRICHKL